jgi:phosphatidylethanolamine/phosphatidyl-N-methylethanolamine N-methyltransferase
VLPDWSLVPLLWLRKPLDIAALLPSGPWVAAAVAGAARLDRPGHVLELGGGTGSITHGLLKAGCAADRLIVIEREREFVDILRRRFPGITVIEGDATQLGALLRERGITSLATVVSTLPIKYFRQEAQAAILKQSFELLGDTPHFVQITNQFTSPLPIAKLGLEGKEVARVWRSLSLLPVQVWFYRPA